MRSVVALAIAALAILVPRAASAQLMSPGDLSEAHAAIDNDDDCGKCHEAGKKVVARLCLDCHDDLRKRIDAGAGLHGKSYRGKACETCHVEHIGRKTKLVRWPGGAMEKLDHDDTGWALEGDHAQVKCLACHKSKQPSGKPSFLGTKTACASCHKDPHAGRLGNNCVACHDQRDWKTVDLDAFDHDLARFKLTGSHKKVKCAECHGTPSQWTGIAFDTCDQCHTDPHKGRFGKQACTACHDTGNWRSAERKMRRNHPGLSLRNGHARVGCKECHDRGTARGPSKGDDCVDCHRPVHEAKFGNGCESCHKTIEWLGLPDEIGRGAHDKTPYPLRGKHAGVSCESCHKKKLPVAKRYRGLEFDRCMGCHADKHAGEFAKRDGGECGACHGVGGFTPTTFGPDDHATTAFALDGRHGAAPCSGCHGGKRPRLDLRVAKQACVDCHENPHGDQFATEMAQGGCAQCHSPADWKQPKIDHSIWPLTGAHGRTACAGCHGEATDVSKPGTYRGVPRDCEGCHDDAHAGQFRLAAPVRACTDCHGTEQFTVASFDHAAKASYALEGKHASTACEKCHPKTSLRGGGEAQRFRLGYRACKDCHADPHREGDKASIVEDLDCSACHAPAGWTMGGGAGTGASGFDHDKTGFPLRGAHEQTSCLGCHGGDDDPATTCDGCHKDPHQGRVDGACVECHMQTSWDDTETLERHRRSRMPLTGRHALLDCESCHRRQGERTYSDTPTDCFACHADDYRSDIHPDHDGDAADPGLEPFSRDCARCHRTTGWSPALVDASAMARRLDGGRAEHDRTFVLSRGPHRDADCATCHGDRKPTRRVRCDGCHGGATLRAQHGGKATARGASRCLACHPRGVAR